MSVSRLCPAPGRLRHLPAVRYIGRLTMFFVLAGLLSVGAGCGKDDGGTKPVPEHPVLALSTTSVDFDSTATERTFTITNTGTGTLTWTVIDDQDWSSVAPTTGSTATEQDEITVTVDRSGLSPGSYTGTVTVTPGSGDPQTVAVSMSVVELPPAPTVLSFATVPHGTFTMGDGVATCGEDERQVTLTEDFFLGQTEVTNQQYLEMMQWAYDNGYVTATSTTVQDNLDGSMMELLDLDGQECEIAFDGGTFTLRDAGHGINPDHPVKEVTWYGAAAFCDWLSLREGLPRAYDHGSWACNGGDPYHAQGYRLPTDAEWECAAQYDDGRVYPWGDDPPSSGLANFGRSTGWTMPVGSYPAEKTIGGKEIYDMAGNLWEWCNDWWICDLGSALVVDPTGPPASSNRVLRGGSWYDGGALLRCAIRGGHDPRGSGSVGFRVARTVNP